MIKIRKLFVFILLTVLSLYFSSAVYATENAVVSTAEELVQWMEEHKNTGGSVSLGADITLSDMWYFIPDGPGMPSITVEMNGFHITVEGEISFHSDNHLMFQGAADEEGVFRVVPGGQLFLKGLAVGDTAAKETENEGYTLVQEEGAGLIVEDCQVSGRIHFAHTPFIIDSTSLTVIADSGQTAADVLPSVLSGKVNRDGQAVYEENIPVAWKLAGTEKKQEQRERFTLQGYFPGAASMEPLTCTVVYNDFPLTFTDVKAEGNRSVYLFRGGYTEPEKHIPMLLATEYSFDNKNWIQFDADYISPGNASFFISVTKDEWDVSVHPYVYIRLHGSDNGTEYFSNVLRYSSDLKQAEQQGGSRGGSTTIVEPFNTPVPAPELTPTPIPTSTPESTSAPVLPGGVTEQVSRPSGQTSLPTPASVPAVPVRVPEVSPLPIMPVCVPERSLLPQINRITTGSRTSVQKDSDSHQKSAGVKIEGQGKRIKKASVKAYGNLPENQTENLRTVNDGISDLDSVGQTVDVWLLFITILLSVCTVPIVWFVKKHRTK